MARVTTVLDELRQLVSRRLEPSGFDQGSDRALLERFLERKDEAAFETLVHRHASMVLGIARRVLGHVQDAEDVFQATFLVLARKAAAIRKPEGLASWLHGVAYRLALKLRQRAAGRHAREAVLVAPAAPSAATPLDEVTWRELRTILDEELRRLPERCRAGLVLCYLEGRTQDEAARQLGWSYRTFRKRLDRARTLLAGRLSRRGVALSAGLLATLLSQAAEGGSRELTNAASRACLLFTSGSRIPATVSTRVAALAEGGIKAMANAKLLQTIAIVLITGLLAAGGGAVLGHRLSAIGDPSEEKPQAARPVADSPQPKADLHGDPLPAGAVARMGSVRFRHGKEAVAVAFAPGGKTFASASSDGTVRLWETATGREVRRFTDDGDYKGPVAFSPDGTTLAAASWNRPVSLWDVATGREIGRFGQFFAGSMCLAFSPDGKTLAATVRDIMTGKDNLTLWDVAAWKELRRLDGHKERVYGVAFSPDGQTLASGGQDGTIRLWEVATGKELHQFKHGARQVAFSPDGKLLAAGGEKSLRLWDAATRKELQTLPVADEYGVRSLAFSPDSRTLVAGGNNLIRFWDVATGRQLRELKGYFRLVDGVAFSPDGKVLASADHNHMIRLWDVATGKPLSHREGHQETVLRVAFSPDGKVLASGSWDGTLRLWDPATGKELRQLRGVMPVAYSPNGRLLLGAYDGVIHLWDPATGDEVRRFNAHPGGVQTAVFAPDGKTLVSGGRDNIVRLWETATGKEIRSFKGHAGLITSIALSPDAKTVASAAVEENFIRLWETDTGKEQPKLPVPEGHDVDEVAFAPDGRALAAAIRQRGWPAGLLWLWDLAAGKQVREFEGHKDGISHVTFSPDGKSLASASHDKTVRLWEVATGKERARFEGHQSAVFWVAFSPEGTRLASGSVDATALVWDLTGPLSGRQLTAPLTSEELHRLWGDLVGSDAAKAYEAMGLLAQAPVQTVALVRRHVRPISAAAASELARHLRDLDNNSFAVREQATRELHKLQEAAEPALREALKGRLTPETRQRIESLLEKLDVSSSLERLRVLRAVEVLERIGDSDAQKVLQTLAQGATEAQLTHEAKAALGRLGRQAPGER